MKDLDFDELDRAVNSLMTNAPKSAEDTQPEDAEKTLDLTREQEVGRTGEQSTGSPGMPIPSPSPVAASAPEVPAGSSGSSVSAPPARGSVAPATRRVGRFMDVVHPSADMKKPAAPERPRVSRQGVTIAPSPAVEAAQPKPSEIPAPPEKESPGQEEKPLQPSLQLSASTPEQPVQKNDWPDPLEMADFADESKAPDTPGDLAVMKAPAAEEKSLRTEESTEKLPQSEDTSKSEDQAPLTSPFLSDAKVEKRPLGGGVPDDELGRAPVLGEKASENLALADPEAQLPADPEVAEAELPEELQGDLVEIEADVTLPKKASESQKSMPPVDEKIGKPYENSAEEKPALRLLAAPEEEKQLPSGPTSIAQQYREEPSSGAQDSGAIYDTDTYHQPLSHPVKKKSGWLWVVWIVMILLLGAGAGAALYFLGIM